MMTTETNYLVHHGIKGQKWGVRRFQNLDGTRTAAGKARERNGEQESSSGSSQRKGLSDAQKSTLKKVAIGAGVAAAAGLAVYGAMKYSDAVKTEAWNMTIEKGESAMQQIRRDTIFWESSVTQYNTDKSSQAADLIKMNTERSKVIEREVNSINDAARYNSSSFKRARETLKGNGKESIPERMAKGYADAYIDKKTGNTIYEGRTAYEAQLKKRLNELGYLTQESRIGGTHMKGISKKNN